MCCCCCSDCCLVLLALLFPPLPVWIKRGFCSTDSFINIILTILGYIPGLIHSFYIISKYPLPPNGIVIIDEECGEVIHRDRDGVRVVRVHPHHHHEQPVFSQGSSSANTSNNRNYGAIEPPAYTEVDRK